MTTKINKGNIPVLPFGCDKNKQDLCEGLSNKSGKERPKKKLI
jgi:hypothetical protein